LKRQPEVDRVQLTREIIKLQQRVNRALGQYVPEAWLEVNLTIGQLKSLVFIANQDETNFRKLAAALGVTPASVTGIVDRLVEQGLVSREENPEDRRMLLLKATKRGEALLTKLRESRISRMSEILSQLSKEELSALARSLATLADVAEHNREKNRDAHNRS
jgi:DNA-binding MarR family transcriptional regulator